MNTAIEKRIETKGELIKRIELDLKKNNVLFTDSEMFKYCDFYTGRFWLKQAKAA